MKAVILAAGEGKRLYPVTQHRPKCLLELGGRTLLARYLDALCSLGIKQAVIVVGYKQEMIRLAVESYPGAVDIRFVANENFQRGSIGSLWAARHELDDDVVIMDADVLFHSAILHRLVASPHPNALLVDEAVVQEQSEECMAVIRGDRVVALTKHVPRDYDWLGESVGFLKLSKGEVPNLVHSVEQCVHKGLHDMEYEDSLQDFFGKTPVGYEKISGLPWIEIDFPEDLSRAQREILPQLE